MVVVVLIVVWSLLKMMFESRHGIFSHKCKQFP
jgi:hypothetical protein